MKTSEEQASKTLINIANVIVDLGWENICPYITAGFGEKVLMVIWHDIIDWFRALHTA